MSDISLSACEQDGQRQERGGRGRRGRGRIMVVTAVPFTVYAFLTEQLQGITEAGHELTVVCSPANEFNTLASGPFTWKPVNIPRSVQPLALLRAFADLYRLFRREKPDLIHTHTPIAAFLGQIAAWFARVPRRVTTVHGLYFVNVRNPLMRRAFRLLEVTACRMATRVICVADEDRKYLQEVHGLSAAKLETLHVGVNLEVYHRDCAEEDRRAIRAEQGIPADAVVVGIVARMVREKGFVELFQAFGDLARRYPGVHLLHVGPADSAKADALTPETAAEYQCQDVCHFAGSRMDVRRYLAAMDIFCLPSHREGFPVSIMEAAAMGLPGVTTDVRGCREAVVHGSTGLIVPARDPAALGEALEKLVVSPELRQSMSRNAVELARSKFDRQMVVRRTLAIYAGELDGMRR